MLLTFFSAFFPAIFRLVFSSLYPLLLACSSLLVAFLWTMAQSKLFQAGEVILQEEPWVYTLLAEHVDHRCYHCLKLLSGTSDTAAHPLPASKLKNNQCSGCKYARYCSKECQAVDWKERHKYDCQALPRTTQVFGGNPLFLLILQIVAKLSYPKTDRSSFLGPRAGQHTFADIEVDVEAVLADQQTTDGAYCETMRVCMCHFLQLNSAQMAQLPLGLFVEIFGRVLGEVFPIWHRVFERVGMGVYVGASRLGRSCVPNAYPSFVGKRLTLSAVTAIDGIDKVTYSHIDQFVPAFARRPEMLPYRSCSCQVCSLPGKDAEQYGLRCVNRQCDATIPSDARANLPCRKCHIVPQADRQKTFVEAYMSQRISLQSLSKADMSGALRELERLEYVMDELYHPTNAARPLFHIRKGMVLSTFGDVSSYKSFETALDLFRPLLQPADPRLGWCAFYAVDPESPDEVDALIKLNECLKLLGKSFGAEHELVQEATALHKQLAQKLRARIGGRR